MPRYKTLLDDQELAQSVRPGSTTSRRFPVRTSRGQLDIYNYEPPRQEATCSYNTCDVITTRWQWPNETHPLPEYYDVCTEHLAVWREGRLGSSDGGGRYERGNLSIICIDAPLGAFDG